MVESNIRRGTVRIFFLIKFALGSPRKSKVCQAEFHRRLENYRTYSNLKSI